MVSVQLLKLSLQDLHPLKSIMWYSVASPVVFSDLGKLTKSDPRNRDLQTEKPPDVTFPPSPGIIHSGMWSQRLKVGALGVRTEDLILAALCWMFDFYFLGKKCGQLVFLNTAYECLGVGPDDWKNILPSSNELELFTTASSKVKFSSPGWRGLLPVDQMLSQGCTSWLAHVIWALQKRYYVRFKAPFSNF